MWMVADLQPKSTGLVWGLAATRRSVYTHQVNRVNSRNDFGHDDSTINIVIAIIIIIIIICVTRGNAFKLSVNYCRANTLSVSRWSYGHLLKLTDWVLFE